MIGKGITVRIKKRKFFIALAAAVVLTVPFTVYAATSDTSAAKNIRGFFGIDSAKLTDQQKETVKSYSQKMADLQKEFIDSMVSNGAMTREQGDEAIKKIEEDLKNNGENGVLPGFGMGRKGFEGSGKFGGFRKPDGMGLYGADPSKLTDAQKTDVTDANKKIAGLQKELISKMADANAITEENRDAAIKRIDELLADLDKTGTTGNAKGLMNGFGGFNHFGFAGMDVSKLTEEQKGILADYSAKMADVQRDLINKMVASGAITKDQGDAGIKRIDDMLKSEAENGFMNKGMMKGSQFRGKDGRSGSITSGTAIRPAAGSI